MQSPEQTNLAETLDEKELRDIAAKVCYDAEEDEASRSDWEEKHAKWLQLYNQTQKSKNPPWDGSSQESLPLLAEAVNQFQSRSYKAFFPNRYFVDCIPVGKPVRNARERADRVAKHMSYQLGVLDRSYKVNKNQMFMATALHGSDFTKSFFSEIKGKTIIERVRAQDLLVPYGVGPRRIEDVERKTQVKPVSINTTRILKATGFFIDEGTSYTGYNDSRLQQASEEADDLLPGYTYRKNEEECCILEQHCLLDLDGDGIAEPYIVFVDRQSKKTLRIQIRYEVDETGAPVNYKEPIEHFTHYQFLPNPDGFYGLGMGHLLGQMNEAANKIQRMFIDANELATTGNMTYLIGDQLGLPGDEFELSLGRGIKIPRSVEDIRKFFMKLEFQPPGQENIQMLEMIRQSADRISSTSDILAGQPEKVYQPMAMLSMIEQGLQLVSSVQEFIGHSMEDELQKVYRLNAKYLEQDAYFQWGDEQIEITREDYADDFRVVPIFDPKYSTRSQKLAKSQAQYEFVMGNPLTSQDPEAIYLVSKNYLESLDTEDIDTVLKMPQVPQVARIDDQNLENTYFIMPPDKRPLFDVFPDQDHIKHIELIDKFIAYIDAASPLMVPNIPGGDPSVSKIVGMMSEEQKKELIANLLRHRSLHVSYMFGQLNGVLDAQGNPIGQGPAGGMAETPSDEAGLADLISAVSAIGGSTDLPIGQG